jgi:hypothetical protein
MNEGHRAIVQRRIIELDAEQAKGREEEVPDGEAERVLEEAALRQKEGLGKVRKLQPYY